MVTRRTALASGTAALAGATLTTRSATAADKAGQLSAALTGGGSGGNFFARVATTSRDGTNTNGLQTVDGVSLANGDAVFYKDSSNPVFNGLYTVNSGGEWTRASAMPNGLVVPVGSFLFVKEGLVNGGNLYLLNSSTSGATGVTIGTDPLAFSINSPPDRNQGSWVTPQLDNSDPKEPVAQIFGPGHYLITLTKNTIFGILDGVGDQFFETHLCIVQDAVGGWYAKFPGSFHWKGIPLDSAGEPMLSTAANTITFIKLTWMGSNQGFLAEV